MRGEWAGGGGCDSRTWHRARSFMIPKNPPVPADYKVFAIMEKPQKTRPAAAGTGNSRAWKQACDDWLSGLAVCGPTGY